MNTQKFLSALSLIALLAFNACASDRTKIVPQDTRYEEQNSASKDALTGLEQDFDPNYKAPVVTEKKSRKNCCSAKNTSS